MQPLPFRGGARGGDVHSFSEELKERARQMRCEPTEAEKRLWRRLRNSQLGGYKFRRQAVLEPYIADFFCPAKGLVVEVDGDTHTPSKNERRDVVLADRGYPTLRFTNREVRENLEGVLETLLSRLQGLPDRWSGSRVSPTPAPPLKGRGE